MQYLEFRRQYLLSDSTIEKISTWEYFKIPGKKRNLNLYYHPDLEVTHAQDVNKILVLIGYIIDPYHPDLTNAEIVNRLLNLNTLQEIFIETENLNGRYAILYSHNDNTYLFHDVTGFREIYYCFLKDVIYFGSTPDIIKRYADVEMDDNQSLKEFLNSSEYKNSGFWVGVRTPYKNIFHLLPNFYLLYN